MQGTVLVEALVGVPLQSLLACVMCEDATIGQLLLLNVAVI